jgi:rhamnosyltransferase subunit B
MPLRILLPAIGSSGDLHPSLEIGRRLRERGHHVTLVANEIYEPQARTNGLDFVPLGTTQEAESMTQDPRLWHPLWGFGCIMERAVLPYVEPLYRLIEARQGPDLVVAGTSLCFGALYAREKLGVRTAVIHLQPTLFRSLVDSGVYGIPMGPGVPRLAKRAFFWTIDRLWVDRFLNRPLSLFRRSIGLGPSDRHFHAGVHNADLVLALFPAWFAPRQPDWPENTELTGFVLHDRSAEVPLSPQVERFLDDGPPPVIVTPGSAARDRHRYFQTAVEACERAGLRALLITNFPEQLPARLPDGMMASGYLPFGRVFPRCRTVIHHGGIGTLAQAAAAGTPQLVVPNTHDQPDNGARVERLGLGLCINTRRFTARSGAEALLRLGDSSFLESCHLTSTLAVNEDGADRARRLIEFLGSP